jgi:hypothetical protein
VPIESYGRADVAREYDTRKTCAPYCTVNCAQRVALFDNWRAPQKTVAVSLPQQRPAEAREDQALAG